jgi:hypothetical protein
MKKIIIKLSHQNNHYVQKYGLTTTKNVHWPHKLVIKDFKTKKKYLNPIFPHWSEKHHKKKPKMINISTVHTKNKANWYQWKWIFQRKVNHVNYWISIL